MQNMEINFDFPGTSLKGMLLNHDFYVLLVNNVVQEMRRRITNTISLYKLANVLSLFIYFKLVMKLMKFVNFIIYFH